MLPERETTAQGSASYVALLGWRQMQILKDEDGVSHLEGVRFLMKSPPDHFETGNNKVRERL